MPYSASVIAYAFVNKGIKEGKPVTQMKLQKMVYFAHGYHLATYGEPLIRESFEAWKFGPVVPIIYQDFKSYGSRPITDTDSTLLSSFFSDTELDKKAQKTVDYTWAITKDMSAIQLSNWTHQPKAPWRDVYNPNEWSTIINNEKIESYFKSLLKKETNG